MNAGVSPSFVVISTLLEGAPHSHMKMNWLLDSFGASNKQHCVSSLVHFAWMLGLSLLPTIGFSIKPLKVKL